MALDRLLRTLGSFALASSSVAARACTVCDSPTGHQVRAGLFNGHFLQTLLLVAAPFPVMAVAVWLLHMSLPDLALPTNAGREDPAPVRIRVGLPKVPQSQKAELGA